MTRRLIGMNSQLPKFLPYMMRWGADVLVKGLEGILRMEAGPKETVSRMTVVLQLIFLTILRVRIKPFGDSFLSVLLLNFY